MDRDLHVVWPRADDVPPPKPDWPIDWPLPPDAPMTRLDTWWGATLTTIGFGLLTALALWRDPWAAWLPTVGLTCSAVTLVKALRRPGPRPPFGSLR